MRVLLVEDAPRLSQAVAEILRDEGYLVDVAPTCERAEALSASGAHDIILLDIMLPDGSGIDVLRRLRDAGDSTPVILLTARDAVADRVAGLDAGADDYLPKPFHASELFARMRALLRRPREIVDDGLLVAAGLALDARSRLVRAAQGGCWVELTPKEASLLEALMRSSGRVLSKERLAVRVWGPLTTGAGNRLEVLVHALREKIARTSAPAVLETVRGAGYRLRVK